MFAAIAMSGCAQFTTVQTDITDPVTKVRTITTRANARALFAGANTLKGWKASQTDKTQGASIAETGQTSDASVLARALAEGAVVAAIKSTGVPK